jgi:hypothetical protein
LFGFLIGECADLAERIGAIGAADGGQKLLNCARLLLMEPSGTEAPRNVPVSSSREFAPGGIGIAQRSPCESQAFYVGLEAEDYIDSFIQGIRVVPKLGFWCAVGVL